MYYLGLTESELIIKRNNSPWFSEIYQLVDIREIVYERPFKMPVCLRVITNTYESKVYPAGSLWDKTWMQLKEDLEKKGIKVRNEAVSYQPFEFKLFI